MFSVRFDDTKPLAYGKRPEEYIEYSGLFSKRYSNQPLATNFVLVAFFGKFQMEYDKIGQRD
jgi:hypothetical protein